LSQDIGRSALAAVEVHRYDLPGIEVTVEPRRNYIHKESASHLLGYLSEINPDELKCGEYPDCRGGDFIGKFGVEKAYGSFLRGKRGGRQVEVDARGRVVRVLKTVEAQPGHNLYLTIDQRLQAKAEALLAGVVGAVVAMDPNTGELLALASSPSFDQNDFVGGLSPEKWKSLISNPFRPMENKALQGEYPPASTFKIVTAVAGLEEGVIDANTKFYCPGHYRFGNRVYRCWKKWGHGSVDVVRALAESCDVFFYQVGEKLGVDRIAAYSKAFGLGSPTGTNLDREARGLIPTAAWKKKRTGVPWQRGETLSVAIGQGYDLATPLQMAVLTSAIANGGIRYRPSIVKEIRTAQEEVVQGGETQEVDRVKLSRETLELVRRGLWEVVNTKGGTARIARVEGLGISGKTGTAQIVGRKKNEPRAKDEDLPLHLRAHAWFVAYAPSDRPSIAVSVIVEHGEHGSSAAAPIARELIKFYLAPETT
jgi:penicillin-binding protein 2